MNIAYEGAINYLMNTCAPFITRRVTVPNVVQGTTDLTSYAVTPQTGAQASGQSGAYLFGLMNPLLIWWKLAGQPENNYCLADESKDLPFVTPSNYIVGQKMYYEWIEYKLLVTPLGFNADFLVKGEFRPPPLLRDDDFVQIHPMMTAALGLATASLIGGERVNASYLANWQAQAEARFDDISAQLVRKEQSTSQRIGSNSRRAGRGGRGYQSS